MEEKEFVAAARAGDLLTFARFPLDRAPETWKRRALLAATENQRPRTISLLLESGVDPESRRGAFLCALEKRDLEIARIILPSGGAEARAFALEGLLAAAEKGNKEMVDFLLSVVAVSLKIKDALVIASVEGSPEIVEILLDHFPSPAQESVDLSLAGAVAGGNFRAARLLAQRGADPRAYESLLTRCVLAEDYSEIVNLLPKNKSLERLEKKLRVTQGVKCYQQARVNFLEEIGLVRLGSGELFDRNSIVST